MPKAKLPDKNFKWTSNLAYVIGLITTDGCLSNNERSIIMSSSDIQLLKTFKECLNLSNKISRTKNNGWAKRPCYKVQFGNVQLYRWFLKIGLTPRKTYTIGALDVPDKYFRDFLRGHLDGDGSIWTYKDYYNISKNPKYIYNRLWIRFMSASKIHMEWLGQNINRLLSIYGHTYQRKPWRSYQTTSMWKLKFAKKESAKLISWLYYHPDVPCLKRKKLRAQRALKLIAKEKRRKYTKIS